jgi:hypothetical protein
MGHSGGPTTWKKGVWLTFGNKGLLAGEAGPGEGDCASQAPQTSHIA